MVSISRFLLILGLNAVPLWGLFERGWSPATMLVVYWCQTLLCIPLDAALILWHRHLTHKRGHYDAITVAISTNGAPPVRTPRSFLFGFLIAYLPWTLVLGILVAASLGIVLKNAAAVVDPVALVEGLRATAIILVFNFLLDLTTLRGRSFAWIKSLADNVMSRILIMQVAIMVGWVAAAFFANQSLLLQVFISLKLILDLGSGLPQWKPKEVPAGMAGAMHRIFGDGKENFAAYWRRSQAQDERAREEDEISLDPNDPRVRP